jgi:acetolactate synthase-1/2/3 large subunit
VTDLRTFCHALHSAGVVQLFGVPGTQNLALFDAIRGSRLEFTLASHELGAAFMANGYYRASGRPAAVVTIGGPGFTNALTGIAEAKLDSVPLLHLVSAPATSPGESFQLQAIDQAGIAAPLVKRRFLLGPGGDPAAVAAQAVRSALQGEPGPVLIEFAAADSELSVKDRTSGHVPDSAAGESAPLSADHPLFEELGERWDAARRPVLLLGQGCASQSERIGRIVEQGRIPLLTTPSARGILPEDHPLAIGFDVLRGGVEAVNRLLDRADIVIAAGCKLGHNGSAGFRLRLPSDRLVRVDPSDEVLQANYPSAIRLRAEATTLFTFLEERSPERHGHQGWSVEELAEARSEIRRPSPAGADPAVEGPGLKRASEFFRWLGQALPRRAIVVTDSGLHQILARRHLDILSERGLLLPSDFQSMGFGIPAGIGAAIAARDRPIVVLVGDGGLLMSGLEITTAAREGLPILFVVFNDGHLNQIRLQQLRDSGRPFGVDIAELDHERFSEAVGAGFVALHEVETAADLEEVFPEQAPVILEVRVQDSLAMRSKAAEARLKSVARTVRDSASGARSRKRPE